jgi:hypothetical protein
MSAAVSAAVSADGREKRISPGKNRRRFILVLTLGVVGLLLLFQIGMDRKLVSPYKYSYWSSLSVVSPYSLTAKTLSVETLSTKTTWLPPAATVTPASPVCRPSFKRTADNGAITSLYFAHTRKAGGTTLKKFFQYVARKKGWQFNSAEGRPSERPRRPDKFYVTHLRRPVDRVLSSYKYEGRWSCHHMVFPKDYPENTPLANNSQSLEDFIEEAYNVPDFAQCLTLPPGSKTKKKLWKCARNCYLRWFGRDFNCLADAQQSYETARTKLMGYNLVVITERMRDPTYVQGLLRMFFGNDNVTTTIQTTATDILSNTQKMYCFDESRYWNAQYPAVLRNSTLANLTRLNALDTRLYNSLNHCPEGTIFPAFEPGL